MKLSFGNMIVELNIFDMLNSNGDVEDTHEVNLINTLMQDQFLLPSSIDPREACLAHFNDFDEDYIL
ncbi:hypothetical protein ACSBR1_017399 [Camellia fascicularis]